MINFSYKTKYGVYDLVEIMRILRSPEGCPWDREQDHKSVRRNMLEEAYEAVEAIDEESADHLKEELGDLLAQVVFHSEMEYEKGVFDIDDVADGVCKKFILRHPHIFGDTSVSSSEEVLDNWDKIKRVEKGQKTTADAMDSVAKSLPALWRAEKIQKKAAKVGFDFPDFDSAWTKLEEEMRELYAAAKGDGDTGEELGDLLFAAVNVARFLKKDPERELELACEKFLERFRYVENQALSRGKQPDEMTLGELDAFWEEYKAIKAKTKR